MAAIYRYQLPSRTELVPFRYDVKVTVYMDWRIVHEMKVWCNKHIGPNQWNYYGAEKKIPCEFRFKRPEDLLAFRMAHGLY